MRISTTLALVVVVSAIVASACSRRQVPLIQPTSPPERSPAPTAQPTPQRVEDAVPLPVEPPIAEQAISSRPIDDAAIDSTTFQPVFFALDSAELSEVGRQAASANAVVLRANPAWVVTIEGHCDERGTAEYNLALGERRAIAVQAYLLSLGIGPERLRTVSYGKEFPFDSGHNEEAWAKNRRANFVVASR